MCRQNSSRDDPPLCSLSSEVDEDIDVEENSVAGSRSIDRSVLVSYIKYLGGESTTELFITPPMAVQVIDFVYRLKNGTPADAEAAKSIVRKWYAARTSEKVVEAMNDRKKTIDEIIKLLQQDCQLNEIMN